jgi:hypothetical protein
MNVRTCLARRPTGGGSIIRPAILMTALIMTIGPAQAQNATTTSSHTSLSGIQSVITQARDSLQRQARAVKLRLQHKQPPATNPDVPDPIAK